MTTHPEHQAEQAYIDHAYERLEEMRATATARLDAALQPAGSTPQAVHEREIVVNSALHRLAQLDIGEQTLCFGRIDDTEGERFYIGRLAISGADQEPLVVDWRAPVAEPFYRATGRHPMGLRRRRHFATEGRRITGIEDEVFSSANGDGSALSTGLDGDLELVGTGALLAALERSRSGRMRDIVATVQREQDQIIRAPLAGLLVVQGGPGTGKTAVALHRAAYLLYTHRFPLETQGVLVVGPNPLFLRYIEHVLPSLGETGVSLSTIDGLVTSLPDSHVRRRGGEPAAVARVKGDARMAKVVAKAVRDRQRPLPRDVDVPFGSYILRLTVAASAEIVAQVKRRPGSHNARRKQVEALAVRKLHSQYAAAIERTRRTGLRGIGADLVEADADDVRRQLRRTHDFVAALDRMWPVLSAEELLHDLFGSRALLDLATRQLLDDHERSLLHRARSAEIAAVTWTSADLPLLDEARVLLGPVARKPGPEAADVRNYGHIVVDEAQDLSPMQLRVLGRRTLNGSMTIVGDVAQATGHWAPDRWDDIVRHLPTRRGINSVELTVNYRTPAEIMDVAGRVLNAAAPHLAVPQSVRSTESAPTFVAAPEEGIPAETAAAARVEVTRRDVGTAAVIVPASMLGSVRAALDEAGVPYGEPDTDALDADLSLVPVELVKGLEFDSVIVVEPARVVEEYDFGLRALFVALTRATKRLTVVHGPRLPEPLVTATSAAP